MKRLVVIGGGISGLCAAHEAVRHAGDVAGGLEVVVLEGRAAVGGKASSVRRDGWLVEEGPTGYLDNEPELEELLQRTGAHTFKLTADQAAARRYLFDGRLRELKANPFAFAASGILGPAGLVRLAAEPFIPAAGEERRAAESIWDFAARRLGSAAADRLIAPMVLGVFAGDARELSLTACFPKLARLEREHGGLIRGMLATRRTRAREERFATGPSGKLVSAPGGLQSLPRQLAARGSFTTRCSTWVDAIEAFGPAPVGAGASSPAGDPAGGAASSPAGDPASGSQGAGVAGAGADDAPRFRVVVRGEGEALPAHALVLAGEAFANAALIARLNPEVAALLREIATPPVAVVAMGYGPEVAREFPTGFGVLIPRGQGYRILGCIWDSQLFPHRSPTGHLLVRAMLGGGIDPQAAALDDEALVALTHEELGRLFGIHSRPLFTHVANWGRAIPQYDLGHPRRIERIETALRRTPGVFLAGNGLHGVAFARSAVTGIRQGRAAARWLAGWDAT